MVLHRKSQTISALLVDPKIVRARAMQASVGQEPAIDLLGCEKSLTLAYNLTEQGQPDVVIVAAEQAMLPEFPMYAAMLEILHVRCLILTDGAQAGDAAGLPFESVSSGEIDRAGGLGPYLAALFGLASKPAGAGQGRRAGQPAPALPSKPASQPVPGRGPAVAGGAPSGWKTVVIGASTGGIEALLEVLSHYEADCPPTLIVQHISAGFLPGFAQRLDRHCAARVAPAGPSGELRPGQVVLAPGNSEHLTIVPPGNRYRLVAGEPVSGHRPSVDALFHSVVPLGPKAVGVILTGMGRDGADGLAAIRRAGGWTIGQNRESCTVYGMPRAAHEAGAVSQQLDLVKIGPALLKAAKTAREGARA